MRTKVTHRALVECYEKQVRQLWQQIELGRKTSGG